MSNSSWQFSPHAQIKNNINNDMAPKIKEKIIIYLGIMGTSAILSQASRDSYPGHVVTLVYTYESVTFLF